MDTPAGRRGNGLQAADWGALVDLDPRLAEALLDRLATAGVPAYVEPATAAGDPWPRAALPNRPLDRLWVDPDRAAEARTVVAAEVADLSALLAETDPGATAHGLVQPVPRHAARRVLTPPPLPDPPRAQPAARAADRGAAPTGADVPPAGPSTPLDDDEVFRQIVAGFDLTRRRAGRPLARGRGRGRPGAGPGGRPRRRPPASAARRPGAPRRRRDDAALPGWLEPDALEPEADDPRPEGYVPPPPPPAPRISVRTLGAVAVLVLGLVLVFVPQALGQFPTTGTLLLGIALLGGGAAALVLRVRDAPDDSGPGDGAVV